jgi:glutamyl-tRNA synthetase/glutamyl-Q tRNA(Asp) synthetase
LSAGLPPGWTTRFAPAPTGRLHLGHVVNALWVWGLARAHGGRVLLRIEDHDRARSRAEHERALLDDLDWLGFAPDAAPVRQSDRAALYQARLAALDREGLVYACRCSRREIGEAAGEGAELRYPGTCRERVVPPETTVARRVRFGPEALEFDDLRLGPRRQVPAEQCGDLLARDRDGFWTYQFAVVVDDLEQRVDLVVRGEDLLDSTGRQILLARMLGRQQPPHFLHHALVRRPDGAKLSKANRDEGIADLRAAGWPPARVLGAAARAAGWLEVDRPVVQEELAALAAGRAGFGGGRPAPG